MPPPLYIIIYTYICPEIASHRDDYILPLTFIEMKLMAHIYPYMLWDNDNCFLRTQASEKAYTLWWLL